ncbi:MAG: NMT1/THI5 like protein [bacterium ADurb.Bin363]|nr:MAG: NMT1/THI5 like protein [bacterium ADurb.Bin363]
MQKIIPKLAIILLVVMLLLSFSFFSCKTESSKEKDLVNITFITPRGTVEVMDDYCLWVAKEMGYFSELGINLIMEPGPLDALATCKFVDQKQADIGYPSPGVLTASIDAGMDVIMIYDLMATQVFDFAMRPDSDIKTIKDLEGRTISLGTPGWQVIVDPILVEAGVDPSTVEYVNAGDQWGQAAALGQADVALCWKGLRSQWLAQGLDLRFLIGGVDFSKMPANGYCIRKSDLKDEKQTDILVKALKGSAMGIHFTRNNPRAAAQITYGLFPAVQEQMTPELAFASLQELHELYSWAERNGYGYGWASEEAWGEYLQILADLGQTKTLLPLEDVFTSEYIDRINDFDHGKVAEDARNYKLDEVWSKIEVKGVW